MKRDECLSCRRRQNTHQREGIVRRIVERMIPPTHYPYVFTLINDLQLCTHCIEKLPWIDEDICLYCGRMIPLDGGSKQLCSDCREVSGQSFLKNRSCLRYDDWTKAMLHRWKYRGDEQMLTLFVQLLVVAYYRFYKNRKIDVITYVPLHTERLQERGFNQAQILAASFAKRVHLPVLPLLERVKNTVKQSKQSGKRARMISMESAFWPMDEMEDEEEGKAKKKCSQPANILLIDDIYTTGSTIRACATAIKSSPKYSDSNVFALTIGR